LESKIKDTEEAVEDLNKKQIELDKKEKELKENYDMDALKKEVEDTEQYLEKTNSDMALLEQDKTKQSTNVEFYEEAIEKLRKKEKEIEGIADELVRYNKLLGYMGDFKISMISQITPKLSEMLSDFVLNSTNIYSRVELNEDYDISVEIDGQMQPIDILSGGAEDLFNVCLRFSISRYLNEASGSLMRMVFMDEVFGSQDVNRRKNLLAVMESLKMVYDQIIIITHVEDVTDYVDSVIRVIRDPVMGSCLQ